MNTRRDFLRKGAFAGLGMLTMSELAKAVVSKQKEMYLRRLNWKG